MMLESRDKIKELILRVVILMLGLTIAHLGVSLFLLANLGSDPFNVFVQGVYSKTALLPDGISSYITHGRVHIVLCLLIILLLLLVDRSYIRVGTVLCMIFGGPIIDFFNLILSPLFEGEISLWIRILVNIFGCAILAFGMTIVIESEAGTGPNDLVAIVISDRKRWRFGVVRVVSDILFAGIGFVLGGTIGLGTIICAFVVGPVADIFKPMNKAWITKVLNEIFHCNQVKRSGDNQIMNQDITRMIGDSSVRVEIYDKVTSTNQLLKERAGDGDAEGLVIVANSQSAGKGRIGRAFFSPPGTGIYMSLLLRPNAIPMCDVIKLTTLASVIACEVIEEVVSKKASVKWVNDIFVDGYKCAGILTETSMRSDNKEIDYVVLGIGINVLEPEGGFPSGIEHIAGALLKYNEQSEESIINVKNRIITGFVRNFFCAYKERDFDSYVEKYIERSFVIGKEVNVVTPIATRTAIVLDITNDCELVVKYEDGSMENLQTGEISIRPL